MSLPPDSDSAIDPPSEEDEDCYFDGPYLVFTAAYHLKRGYCCQSGCRHCPYGYEKGNDADAGGSAAHLEK